MRHYEIVFLVHPDQSKQVPAMIDRYSDMVTSSEGKVHRSEDWGRRRLAYTVNDVYKAHYVLMNIECDLPVLGDIEKNFKFNDSILRHLVIRRKTAITEESAIAKQKAKDDASGAVSTAKPEPVAKVAEVAEVADTKQDESDEATGNIDEINEVGETENPSEEPAAEAEEGAA